MFLIQPLLSNMSFYFQSLKSPSLKKQKRENSWFLCEGNLPKIEQNFKNRKCLNKTVSGYEVVTGGYTNTPTINNGQPFADKYLIYRENNSFKSFISKKMSRYTSLPTPSVTYYLKGPLVWMNNTYSVITARPFACGRSSEGWNLNLGRVWP